MWGWASIEAFWQDVRYGLRVLAKHRGFTAVAVLTLALGIGANTAIFSLIDAVILRSLPVWDPERLVVFRWNAHHEPKYHGYSTFGDCGPNGHGSGCSFSVPLFDTMRAQAKVFSGLTAFAGPAQIVLSGNGAPSMARGEIVSGSFFSTVGVGTALGRPLGPADDSPSAPPAVVLSYGYWQSAFGGERSAVGRTIRLNGAPFTIVGVADPRFTNLAPGKTQDFFLPLAAASQLNIRWLERRELTDPQAWWVVMLARLKQGVSVSQAQAVATSIFRNEMLHGGKPLSKEADDPAITLAPAPEGLTGERGRFSTLLYVLMFAVGFVLLIACANVAGLMPARSMARQKEIAVRLALGAGRRRVARQLLTESVILSLAGGALGVLLAYWGVRAITALLPSGPEQPFPFVVAPDWRVLAFTLCASVLTGILFGLAPALRGTRLDLTPALKESAPLLPIGTAQTRRRFRRFHLGGALVVAQVALSILVLMGAGLLVRTLQNLHAINPGFDTHNILIFGIEPTLSGYKDTQIEALYRDLQGRLTAIPGVVSASYSSDALLNGGLWTGDIHLPWQPEKSSVETDMLAVGPGFFSTMRIPLLAGRMFTSADFAAAAATDTARKAAAETARTPSPAGALTSPAAAAPIPVIINEAFARQFLGKQNPLGQHVDESEVEEPRTTPKSPGYQIIGIVGNTKYNNLRREIHPAMYRPVTGGGANFELRTASEPTALIPLVRSILNQVNSNLPLFDVRTQSDRIEQLVAQERFIARLSSFFGVLALVLASIGLYGLLAYEVTRRTREIGIRMAVGARQGDVLRLVVGQGIFLALAGGAVGIAASLGMTRYLASLLYGVRPSDPVTLAAVAILLFVVALAACYIPARQATKVDPMVALRYE